VIIQKSYGLKLAALDPQGQAGRFTGTAVVYGDRDSYGDKIRQGAFSKSIADAGGKLPLLWVHQASEVLGSIRIEQDAKSLNVSGALLTDDIPRAREVHALLKAGAVKGLSVGFMTIRAAPLEDGGTEFIEGRLLEISLCPTPAFASAQVNQVKAIGDLAAALDPTRDRDALMSLRDSINMMLDGSHGQPDHGAALAAALATFDASKWRQR
jgi:hypothetical protein